MSTSTVVRPLDDQLYTVRETMALLKLSRSSFYREVRRQRLLTVHQGRATRVPAVAIADYVALLEREAEARR